MNLTRQQEMYLEARELLGGGYVPDYYEQAAAGFIQIAEGQIQTLREALQEFMDIWGSRDAHSNSRRAQARRAAMWDKAKAAMENSR